ncbi:MAG: hypothetical protein LQ344_000826 [Seirophora lacunosa]|nr:MAG: hypothetical protein LQ344_000826 [Seirophora lacunosa]
MPSVRYYNQTAPFWDFIANLENNAGNHPFFSAYNPESRDNHRGGRSPGPPPPHDGPSPPSHEGPPPPSDGHHPHHPHSSQDHPHPPHSPHERPFGPGFPFGRRPHGGRGGRRGGGLGGGPFPAWGGWGNDLDLNKIAEFFASQFNTEDNKKENESNSSGGGAPKDFSPPADIFDTEDNYVVHVSLPGAKKEDVGVNWDADKSELSVAGVVYRPGDEDFLKTLALDERQVGVFERKVRLGSRASPAAVDEDGMSAKMEDGVLMVTIPKKDAGYVEVKKVDIE